MSIHARQSGQSLLEMIFAIGILLVVVIVLLGLTASAIGGQQESETQVVANNLAREGVEVVRSIRDGNWLAREKWNQGLDPVQNAIVVFDVANPNVNHWELTSGNPQLWRDGAVFSHLQAVGAQATIYNRAITLSAICEINTPASQKGEQYVAAPPQDCGADVQVGVLVESTVSWSDRGRPRQVVISDILYAWR